MTEYSALLVLSTHLIEEIANLLEDIIIIDQGKLIRAESIETILKNGRIVSGPKEQANKRKKNAEQSIKAKINC